MYEGDEPKKEESKASSSTIVPAEDLPPPPGIPQPPKERTPMWTRRQLEDAKDADGGGAADSEERGLSAKAQKNDSFARRLCEFEDALGNLLTGLEPSRGPVFRTHKR